MKSLLTASLVTLLLLLACDRKTGQTQSTASTAVNPAQDPSQRAIPAKDTVPLCATPTNDKEWYGGITGLPAQLIHRVYAVFRRGENYDKFYPLSLA